MVSCQDVIEVKVPSSKPRLVIEASINWFKGTNGKQQSIKLSLTAPYFSTEIPPANNATVTITDTNNNTFSFIEDADSGIYFNNNFIPVLNDTYILTVIYNDETYTATETFVPVSNIDSVEQKNDGGFSGNEIEIKAYYTDPADQKNFYFFEFENDRLPVVSLNVYDDEFTDGNRIFAFYSDEDAETGDILTINNYGISERYYEYLFILLQQTDEESGDPFETQPSTVRGNCINQTNPNNFPLGYFRLSQADQFIYTIE
tara:strand:+ start:14627 stop:15403 length:777 start_codon:yes stop_codon:yes gene_type:complete